MGKSRLLVNDAVAHNKTQYPDLLAKIRAQQAEDAKRNAAVEQSIAPQDMQSQPAPIRAH